MSTDNKCPNCGTTIAAEALMGMCPDCLLKAGVPTGSEAGEPLAKFVPPTPAELAQFFPQLEILELIGKGGMGAVYKARQKELDRLVAVKILPPGVSDDPAFAERFAHEAKALAKLNHPNIVTIHDCGQADGLFYFVMEFVDGMNLRQLLHARRIAPREALAIVPQICDALQYAHDTGIVHRDIKPENILLDRQGRVKVADFGLAKLIGAPGGVAAAVSAAETQEQSALGTSAATAMLTEAGKVMGTPPYMAPEQKEHPTEVDHRADIYSLGVVFYQMLTGELPAGRKFTPPSRKVRIDVRLDEVVLRALEKEPDRRYQTAAQVKTIVETILADQPSVTTERILSWVKGHPVGILGGIALAVVVAFLAIQIADAIKSRAQVKSPGRIRHAATKNDPVWANAVNLLPFIDLEKDVIKGRWTFEDGKLVSTTRGDGILQIPYEPPREYDFRIVFTRWDDNGVCQILSQGGRAAVWWMGWSKVFFGFDEVDAQKADRNRTTVRVSQCLQDNRRYTSVLQVRDTEVQAYLDGKLITTWKRKPDYTDASLSSSWRMPNERLLGIANHKNTTAFHAVELLEVTGKGKPLRGTTIANH